MKKRFSIVLVLLACLAIIPLSTIKAAALQSPVGYWTTIDDKTNKARSIIRITERNGLLSGQVIKVFKQPGDVGFCHNCPGRFKGKPVKGLNIMWGLKSEGSNVWSGGSIIDPKIGKIYRVKMTLMPNGKQLKVRGYIGISLFGRNQIWHRR